MKTFKILFLSFGIFFMALVLVIAFKFSSSLPVLTKDQTMAAIIGKWDLKDLARSGVKNIVFTNKKNTDGDYIYIMTFQKKDSNGNVSVTGAWRYASVGKIEIWDLDTTEFVLHFNFINRGKMAMEDNDIYIKDNNSN
jgi:hypothetical protein